ncbi:hypothetical protein Trydic_g16677 [Trypoxylus dichotomus]
MPRNIRKSCKSNYWQALRCSVLMLTTFFNKRALHVIQQRATSEVIKFTVVLIFSCQLKGDSNFSRIHALWENIFQTTLKELLSI